MFKIWSDAIDELLDGRTGDVMAELTGDLDIKERVGPWFLTEGVVERKELYVSALKLAMVPFLKRSLFLAVFS